MPLRAIVLLAAGLLAPAAAGAATGIAETSPVQLPLEWFAGSTRSAGELWQAGAMGPTTYSYLRSRRSAFLLDAPVNSPKLNAAEQTYTVVERVRRNRVRRPLANAAFLFASAVCGIGGLAWWRCSSRGPS